MTVDCKYVFSETFSCFQESDVWGNVLETRLDSLICIWSDLGFDLGSDLHLIWSDLGSESLICTMFCSTNQYQCIFLKLLPNILYVWSNVLDYITLSFKLKQNNNAYFPRLRCRQFMAKDVILNIHCGEKFNLTENENWKMLND